MLSSHVTFTLLSVCAIYKSSTGHLVPYGFRKWFGGSQRRRAKDSTSRSHIITRMFVETKGIPRTSLYVTEIVFRAGDRDRRARMLLLWKYFHFYEVTVLFFEMQVFFLFIYLFVSHRIYIYIYMRLNERTTTFSYNDKRKRREWKRNSRLYPRQLVLNFLS